MTDTRSEAWPKWTLADPDQPETWPEEGAKVLTHVAFLGDPTNAHVEQGSWTADDRRVIDAGPSVLHWMPWSAIGDPT